MTDKNRLQELCQFHSNRVKHYHTKTNSIDDAVEGLTSLKKHINYPARTDAQIYVRHMMGYKEIHGTPLEQVSEKQLYAIMIKDLNKRKSTSNQTNIRNKIRELKKRSDKLSKTKLYHLTLAHKLYGNL